MFYVIWRAWVVKTSFALLCFVQFSCTSVTGITHASIICDMAGVVE